MTVQQIHELSFRRDGVRYTIHVERSDDGLIWGTWDCHECCMGGLASKSSPGVSQAVEAALDSLEFHHNTYHSTR